MLAATLEKDHMEEIVLIAVEAAGGISIDPKYIGHSPLVTADRGAEEKIIEGLNQEEPAVPHFLAEVLKKKWGEAR